MKIHMISIDREHYPLAAIASIGLLTLCLFGLLAVQVDSAKRGYLAAREQLDRSRSEIWDIGKFDRPRLEKQLANLLVRYDAGENMSVLIGEISEIAKNNDLAFTSIAPREKVAGTAGQQEADAAFDYVPIEIRLEGAYKNISGFLASLGDLEHGVMRIDHFDLTKAGKEAGQLTLSLSARVFVKKKPDQQILSEAIIPDIPASGRGGKSRFLQVEGSPFEKRSVESGAVVIDLQGIIYDPVSPIALIGGEVKRVGSEVSGMKIRKINQTSVVFEKNGEEIQAQLGKR